MNLPSPSGHVLVVEDDERLASLLCEYLREHDLSVELVEDGEAAYQAVAAREPDIVLLDWMLPGDDDGIAICRKLRATYRGPIIMLTARRTDADQVQGLEVGADDYVIKPVDPRVLLARVRAHLRRTQAPSDAVLRFGRLHVAPAPRTALVEGAEIHFTDMELRVLSVLAQHAPDVVSRELLTRAVRGVEYDGLDRGVDIHISRVRRKLFSSNSGARIRSVRGEGYFVTEDEG
ncbi:MAG: response regulator transcription factor [Sandaracinaceae bacterium]